MNKSKKNFALFFTRGLSLEVWDRLGMFEREVALYRKTAATFETVYFFTYGSNDKIFSTQLPSNVIIVPKPAFIPAILYSFFLPFIHAQELRTVDIIKTNQMDGSWAAVIAKKLYGATLIIRCGYEWLQFIEQSKRSWVKRRSAYLAEKFAYTNADKIIVTSVDAQRFVIARFGIASSVIAIIPNYVNTDLFAPLDIPKEGGRVIAIGRLEPQKNLVNLIRAMKGLQMKLVLIGRGSEREIAEQEAKSNGVSIEFKGELPQSALVSELCKSEIYILPSIYEGHPKTLLEAMACGMACIGTNIGGIRDTITDGEDGMICETTVESIRNALVTLHADGVLRDRLGSNAYQTIQQKYKLEKILEKELVVYAL